ncbi:MULTISPECIES: hypothetical protein [unclassified Mesorhizobium]|uniref:hypothetical protein n=1 Tax=unclassified Mesorhizobium TaxID=325217 RepID=UPI0033352F98
MLQHLDVGPGLEQDRRSQDDRQIARPGDNGLPFGQPFFFSSRDRRSGRFAAPAGLVVTFPPFDQARRRR